MADNFSVAAKPKGNSISIKRTNDSARIAETKSEPNTDERDLEKKVETKLLDVNDYCLLRIFGYLNLIDLYAISNTCKRLREVADGAGNEHKSFDFNDLRGSGSETVQYSQTACIFRRFGNFIRKLNINDYIFEKRSNRNTNQLMEIVVQYCQAHLTELTKSWLSIDISLHLENFVSIEKLSIIGSTGYNQVHLPALKVLKLSGVIFLQTVGNSPIICPNLEELYCTDYKAADIIQTIILQSSHLIVLSLDGTGIPILTIHHLKELEYFQFNKSFLSQPSFQALVQNLSCIQTLKTIKLNCWGNSINNLVENLAKINVNIECLNFSNCVIDEKVVNNLKRMVNLKELMLDDFGGNDDSQFDQCLVNLPSVNELHIRTMHTLETTSVKAMLNRMHNLTFFQLNAPNLNIMDEMYHDILDIVKSRPQKIKLEMVLHDERMEKPEGMTNEDLEWFEVLDFTPPNKSKFDDVFMFDYDDSDDYEHYDDYDGYGDDSDDNLW